MPDFIYYWQKQKNDLVSGPIYKLNQNSRVMEKIAVGDDIWAIGLIRPDHYALIARFTVAEVGQNEAGSPDAVNYGTHFFRSSEGLTNYFGDSADAQQLVRSLSIRCEGAVLGQTFRGGAAVRPLSKKDREALIQHIGSL